MRPLRILDPSGATVDWLTDRFPDATIHRFPDEEAPYDAAMFYGDLDNSCDPGERLAALSPHIKRPDGRIYVGVREGAAPTPTPGRRRSWVSVDVADLLRRFGYLEEFGVDDDGYISAAITPHAKRGEVAVWTGRAIGPWDPMDIVNRGLGGSETAAYRIADLLSDMGYVVTLYGQFRQEGAIKDVILRDYRRFDPTAPRKAVIAFRNAEMFDTPVNAALKVLWLEDVAGGEGINETRANQISYICGVSGWHRQNVLDTYPWLAPEKVLAARNGITRTYFEDDEDEQPPERERRLLYTSSPDRGLDIVLECWPEILERVPDAELYHCYGPWYDEVAKVNAATASHRARCRQLADAAGDSVHAVGPLGQKDLAMLMRSSLVWCHPSYFSLGNVSFNETSCLTGDTLVDMPRNYRTHPDGIPIGSLEGESGFPVWAWDEDAHRFTLATANRVWKASENAETVRIELEEDTVLTCTPDHLVLTIDGDWVEAGALVPGDRLRGLNYRFNVALNIGDGRWTNEHRVVGEWLEGRELESSEHVHHKGDPTRLDNRPMMLEVLPAGKHHSLTHRGRKHDQHYREHGRKVMLEWKQTPVGSAHYIANAQKAGEKLWEWLRSLTVEERDAWLSERGRRTAEGHARAAAMVSPDEKIERARVASERSQRAAQTRRLREAEMNEDELAALRQRRKEVAAIANDTRWHGAKTVAANHVVRSVSPGPTVDVYDMEVEGLHNFVAGGVVVHNCISAMEAQAAGCRVVSGDWGALTETVKTGVKLKGDPMTPEWRAEFVDHIVEGLTNPDVMRQAQEEGPKAMEGYGWYGVALALEKLWQAPATAEDPFTASVVLEPSSDPVLVAAP